VAVGLKRVIAPTTDVIDLGEAKAYCRVDAYDDDILVDTLINSATRQLDGFDGYLGRCLSPQTWELTLDSFPSGPIVLPLPPLIGVDFIKYTNSSGVLTTVNAGTYEVNLTSLEGKITPKANSSWPSDVGEVVNAVIVRFQAGYSEGVPEVIKEAILKAVATAYELRETVVLGESVAKVDFAGLSLYRTWCV
jgi:uncharacterized phiE125 gp8 family phage protein